MKKRFALGGVFLLGIAALTLRLGCHFEVSIEDQVTPEEHRNGWLGPEALEDEDAKRLVAEMPQFVIRGCADDNTKKSVLLWKYTKALNGGEHLPNYAQQIGDCVSFGAKNAVNYLQASQLAREWAHNEFRPVFPPYIYGISRVQIGGGRLGNGDGSLGVWAAKGVQQYGVLAADAEGCPTYSGSVAKQWGRSGPPQKLIDIAKQTLVKTVSPVRSAQDVCDAITNYYPVTIASNFGTSTIREKNGRMVARWDGSWAHQMAIVGYLYDEDTDERLFYVLNSWGERAHPAPLGDEPPGGFWITWADCDRIVKQGDSFAFSSFDGFPAQDELDFRIFTQPAQAAGVFHWEDGRMKWYLGANVVLAGAVFYFGRRRVAQVAVLLVFVASPVMAGDLDFNVFGTQKQDLDFSIFGCDQVAPKVQGLDFAVFGSDAPIEITQKLEVEELDARPVITIETTDNCAPCKRAEIDTVDLADRFKFVFVKTDGPAPTVSWQGKTSKWSYDGWRGNKFFLDCFEKSQRDEPILRESSRIERHEVFTGYSSYPSRGFSMPTMPTMPTVCNGPSCRPMSIGPVRACSGSSCRSCY
jgi:hypothetical protein